MNDYDARGEDDLGGGQSSYKTNTSNLTQPQKSALIPIFVERRRNTSDLALSPALAYPTMKLMKHKAA